MNKLATTAALSVLALAVSLAGCGKSADNAVLAKVNNATITAADFKKQLEGLTPQMQQAVAADATARKEFLEDLIGIELVVQEAKKLGLDKDAEFKKSMDARKKEIEDYKKKLDQQLQDATKDELFNSVLKKELGEKMAKVPAPTDKEVKDYYAKNREKIIAAVGKPVSLKEIEPQLKMRLQQEKRREVYLAYAKELKAKAAISVDDKALAAATSALAQPKELDLSNMTVKTAPKKEGAGK
jgi:predicted nucleic acid-binding protein